MLAAAILLAAILYLVDKNQAWPKFWRVVKWGSAAAIVLAILFTGYMEYSDHQGAIKAAQRSVKDCTKGDMIDQVACESTDSPSSSSPASKTPAKPEAVPHQ